MSEHTYEDMLFNLRKKLNIKNRYILPKPSKKILDDINITAYSNTEFDKILKILEEKLDFFLKDKDVVDEDFYILFPTLISPNNIFPIFLWEKIRRLNVVEFVSKNHTFNEKGESKKRILIFEDKLKSPKNLYFTLVSLISNNRSNRLHFDIFVSNVNPEAYEELKKYLLNFSNEIGQQIDISWFISFEDGQFRSGKDQSSLYDKIHKIYMEKYTFHSNIADPL